MILDHSQAPQAGAGGNHTIVAGGARPGGSGLRPCDCREGPVGLDHMIHIYSYMYMCVCMFSHCFPVY